MSVAWGEEMLQSIVLPKVKSNFISARPTLKAWHSITAINPFTAWLKGGEKSLENLILLFSYRYKGVTGIKEVGK